MNALFDEADGSEWNIIDLNGLGAALGLPLEEIGNAAKYLEGEGLIEGIWSLGTVVPAAHLTSIHRLTADQSESIWPGGTG